MAKRLADSAEDDRVVVTRQKEEAARDYFENTYNSFVKQPEPRVNTYDSRKRNSTLSNGHGSGAGSVAGDRT